MDNCEVCKGTKGGIEGNGNVINGKIVCDYCHAEDLMMDKQTLEIFEKWCEENRVELLHCIDDVGDALLFGFNGGYLESRKPDTVNTTSYSLSEVEALRSANKDLQEWYDQSLAQVAKQHKQIGILTQQAELYVEANVTLQKKREALMANAIDPELMAKIKVRAIWDGDTTNEYIERLFKYRTLPLRGN